MTANSDRPLCLYATQRSGSTPVALALGEHCKIQKQIPNYLEYFNHFMKEPYEQGSELIFNPNEEQRKMANVHLVFPEAPVRTTTERMQLLKKHKGEFFFKFFPMYLDQTQRNWIFQNYRTIALYRKNLYEQLLSYLISSCTGIWYKITEEQKKPRANLIAKKSQFDDFVQAWNQFNLDLVKINPADIICYEDFSAKGPAWLFRHLGLPELDSNIAIPSTEIQNVGDKSKCFTNIDEIKNWYRESELQKNFPI